MAMEEKSTNNSALTGYGLTRSWFDYKADHPSELRAIHAEMYFYIVDLWNRLGQKEVFGLPTDVTMEALEINSYKTYKRTLDKLIEHHFVAEIQKSVNIHRSRKIALVKNTNVSTNVLDRANINAIANDGTYQGTIIDKQLTNKQINNKQERGKRFSPPSLEDVKDFISEKKYSSVSADSFWNFYESKNWMVGKNKMADWKKAIGGWESRNRATMPKKSSVITVNKNKYEALEKKLAKYDA